MMKLDHPRKLFVNLPVRDLPRSVAFFESLGFSKNPQFSDDKGACIVISQDAFLMLLSEPFFKTFTQRERCEPTSRTEAIFALSCESRAEVDDMVKRALAGGGAPAMPPNDHGFMYGHSFYDLDGHHWEVVWMDPKGTEQ